MPTAAPPNEINFLASLPQIQSAVTFSGGQGDGARIKLDLPASEQEAALLLAYHGRARLLEVTIKFVDVDRDETDEKPKREIARVDLRRSRNRRDK